MTRYTGRNVKIEVDGKPIALKLELPPKGMTLRERIADWISGGALSNAQRRFQRMEGFAKKWRNDYIDAQSRLDRIAAQETPGANATVRRMARIARGEE